MANDRPLWVGTSLSGDVLRRMAINVEPASKHASAASAFPNRLRIAAGHVSGGYASPAARRERGRQRPQTELELPLMVRGRVTGHGRYV